MPFDERLIPFSLSFEKPLNSRGSPAISEKTDALDSRIAAFTRKSILEMRLTLAFHLFKTTLLFPATF